MFGFHSDEPMFLMLISENFFIFLILMVINLHILKYLP